MSDALVVGQSQGESRSTARSAVLAIGVGGLAAAALDLLQACVLFGHDIILVIAEGLVGDRGAQGGTVRPPDTDVELGAGQAQAGHARGADRHVALARMLEDHDARAGRERRQRGAITHALRTTAAQAARAVWRPEPR